MILILFYFKWFYCCCQLNELEKNKEAYRIIQSIHTVQTAPSLTGNPFSYLSFPRIRSFETPELVLLSLKLWYTSVLAYFVNLCTVICRLQVDFAIISPIFVLAVAPFLSFWTIHFQLVRFNRLGNRVYALLALTGLCLQSLLWILMAVGFVAGASDGIFALFPRFIGGNWPTFSSTLINLILLSFSLAMASFMKQKLVKILLL